MEPFLQKLELALGQFPVMPDTPGLGVAFSGGLDSTVLLTALTRLELDTPIRALHIDHGLHPDSGSWTQHCGQVAAELGVGFDSRQVVIHDARGRSLEASAREVRYATLTEMMEPAELLLTAHHSDDQLETVLLRLLRGSGVKGLRGIAPFTRLGPGFLGRPMLAISKEDILGIGKDWGLNWVEDPTNADPRFDRNYLRREVVSRLKPRWPSAAVTVGRAARQMADAQEILDSVALEDSARIETAGRISQADLRELSVARRANLLRYLILKLGLPVPRARQLEELLAATDVTRPDAKTQVQWPGGEGRIFRGQLYLFRPMAPCSGPDYRGSLDHSNSWQGPEGRLELCRTDGPGLPDSWAQHGLTVRFRVGGERFKPLEQGHSRKLKKWLQMAGVVPWMRARIPLLYRDSALVAVGDLWLSDQVRQVEAGGPAWRVDWSDHPPIN
ncbi:MAG: tRNA lysidine(34) synthetase TilS [Gammaproteobacteria bacterium]